MKRLIQEGLMFGNLVEVLSSHAGRHGTRSPADGRGEAAVSGGEGVRVFSIPTAPLPRPLPTRGRGGASSVDLVAGSGIRVPPSPLWGGMGWGDAVQGAVHDRDF